jgi:S1-C subfamily serine protease
MVSLSRSHRHRRLCPDRAHVIIGTLIELQKLTMESDEARKKLETLAVEFSTDSFFKSLQGGDREVVQLFLDAGISPDVHNGESKAAVLVASESGQTEIARLLLNRGASPEPLLVQGSKGKDTWDKITASAGILSFISSLLIAAVGGYFTYSYNQRQIDLNRTQADHDSTAKDQANKVLELEAIQKLIPMLTSADEKGKTAALIAIQDLAHPELAAHLAVLFKGQGSVQYLQQAASSPNPTAKRVAVQALSNIATSGNIPDSRMASSALSNVFENTRLSVVQLFGETAGGSISGSGMIVSSDGYILTNAHVVREVISHEVDVVIANGPKKYRGQVINVNEMDDLAIVKIQGDGFVPVHLAPHPVDIASAVIAIGYSFDRLDETALVGTVASTDSEHIYFTPQLSPGMAGGPLLDSTGAVVGMIYAHQTDVSVAIRGDVALRYLMANHLQVLL